MADGHLGPAETADLGLVEPDAVRQPDAVVEPADPFQIVDRPAAEAGEAPVLLVPGLGQMGVQAHPVPRGERQLSRIRLSVTEKGEQGASATWVMRTVAGLVVARDQPLAVGQDLVLALDHGARRQSALVLAQAHAAAGGDQPHAECPGLLDLDVDGLAQRGVEDVVMVAGGGGAGEQEFGQGDPHGKAQASPASAAPRSGRGPPARGTAPCPGRAGRRGSGSGRNGGAC